MFAADHTFEADAIKAYNAGIKVCGDAKDFVTRELLESILKDEDAHIDGIEEVQDQIKQMGSRFSYPPSSVKRFLGLISEKADKILLLPFKLISGNKKPVYYSGLLLLNRVITCIVAICLKDTANPAYCHSHRKVDGISLQRNP